MRFCPHVEKYWQTLYCAFLHTDVLDSIITEFYLTFVAYI